MSPEADPGDQSIPMDERCDALLWLMLKKNGGEYVYVMIGGVPFPARLNTHWFRSGFFPVGVEAACLLEPVGTPGVFTGEESTTYLKRGQQLAVTDSGERHVSTGRRVMTLHPEVVARLR